MSRPAGMIAPTTSFPEWSIMWDKPENRTLAPSIQDSDPGPLANGESQEKEKGSASFWDSAVHHLPIEFRSLHVFRVLCLTLTCERPRNEMPNFRLRRKGKHRNRLKHWHKQFHAHFQNQPGPCLLTTSVPMFNTCATFLFLSFWCRLVRGAYVEGLRCEGLCTDFCTWQEKDTSACRRYLLSGVLNGA